MRPIGSSTTILRVSALTAALAASGCGKSAPKPQDADIAAYLARSQPSYLRVGQVSARFEPISALGSSKLPDGSWRVHVNVTLHASQDLYAPPASFRTQRRAFDFAVARVEEFRVARIAGVERLGQQAGLIAPGATDPEPAVPVGIATHKNQDVPDQVVLLAEPDGHGWTFFQIDAQSVSDEAIGAPMDVLRQNSPTTVFVTEGSEEDRSYRAREAKFLEILNRAPQL